MRERVGAAGEAAALELLRRRGLAILDVDWRCRIGQVDIVARDGDTVVIVEVKARRTATFGLPVEAVDARKRQKLRRLAHAYAQQDERSGGLRIDVVGLVLDRRMQVVDTTHVENAVGE